VGGRKQVSRVPKECAEPITKNPHEGIRTPKAATSIGELQKRKKRTVGTHQTKKEKYRRQSARHAPSGKHREITESNPKTTTEEVSEPVQVYLGNPAKEVRRSTQVKGNAPGKNQKEV